MFDLSRVLETISSFFGSGREAAGQGSDLMSDVLAKAGLDTAFVDGLQAEAMQLLAERGIDPSALTGDQLAALINELRGGVGGATVVLPSTPSSPHTGEFKCRLAR